jgi:hypothetical protein
MDEHDRIAQPRIDPSITPFAETEAFRRYGLRDDPDPASPEPLYLKAIIQEQGFDGPPHVVTRRKLDRYVAAGEVELFRGVADARFTDQMRAGDFFVGRGGEIDGAYAAAGPHALEVARGYARGGVVIRMTLKQGARVRSWRELEALEAAELREHSMPSDLIRVLYNDFGRLAAYLGYDAVHIVDFPEVDNYVVLNRTALRVQQENM